STQEFPGLRVHPGCFLPANVGSMAAAWVLSNISCQSGPDGVQVNIPEHSQKVEIIVAPLRPKPVSEHMPMMAVEAVDVLRMPLQKTMHECRHGAVSDLEEQMEMIGHQTIGVDVDARGG